MASAAAKLTDAVLGETSVPLEEAIRIRAREIWLMNGMQDGSALIDWLEAEKEILAERRVGPKCSRCNTETIFDIGGMPICQKCDKSSGILVGQVSKKPPNTAQSIRPSISSSATGSE